MPVKMSTLMTVLPAATLLAAGAAAESATQPPATTKPNVIVILTDDQGYGDLSCHGNPILETPALDRLHAQSVRFTDFHVAPVCTPTRSQLMTGRDALANGAYCVCSGHEFIDSKLPTMPEIFKTAGYQTGIFGKWHLGHNYPYRPQDRGFQKSLIFRGFGITATSNRIHSECMNPWLIQDGGEWTRYKGYCTDVYFDHAMSWMKECSAKKKPFFTYLATNVPHSPLQVPAKYSKPYAKCGANVAKFFGMIANFDENMERLDGFLKENGLAENTMVIFMTDNSGYFGIDICNGNRRGKKGDYTEGGHRVPCFIRWPSGDLGAPRDIDTTTQVQDILPTLIDLCGLQTPQNTKFDGASLAPLLHGKNAPDLKDRMSVVQCAHWYEPNGPTRDDGAVLWDKWRLLNKGGELYDLRNDPKQERNIAADHPDIVAKMHAFYSQWWARTEPLTRDFPPIYLGAANVQETVLTADNWNAPNTGDINQIISGVNHNGPWHVLVEQAGKYEISLRHWPVEINLPIRAAAPAHNGILAKYPAGKALPITDARLKVGDFDATQTVAAGAQSVTFQVTLPAGRTTLQTWFSGKAGKALCGAYFVYCRKLSTP